LGKVETLQYHLDKGFEINVFFGKKKGHAYLYPDDIAEFQPYPILPQ
jgi:hypothetical protein